MRSHKKFYFCILLSWIFFYLGLSHANEKLHRQSVSFKANTLIEPEALVSGDLTMPAGVEGKVPAVVVIHSAGGFEDSTRHPYVQALNQAGIATLELNLFSSGNRPKTSRMSLPHTFGALNYLVQNPQIDAERIGITGFSYGGLLSLLATSKELNETYTKGNFRFAAHLALYPVCWVHLASIEGKNPPYPKSVYSELTVAPVHILAGEKDKYDAPDSCQKFIEALPDAARSQVNLTTYPDATHGWDTHVDKNYKDQASHQGRGGYVEHYRNASVAQKSLDFSRQFFITHLLKK